jgi:DNA-binding transcriptional LysR family regulator
MKLRPADCLVGFLLSVALAQFSSSSLAANTLRLHPPDTHQLDFPALSLIVEEETGIRLEADPSNEPGDDPLASLLDGSADLAIVENTRRFEPGVRTVLPLYRSVLHLAARQGFSVAEFADGERLPRVQIVNQSPTGRLVADLLFERAEVLPDHFESWSTGDPGQPDLVIYLGPINPRNLGWLPSGFSLVSVARLDAAGAEFYIDGASAILYRSYSPRVSPH